MKDAVEADKEAFRLVVEGKCDAPIRTNIQAPKHEGSFLFMPAYVEEMDTASLKVVDIFPHNIDQGLPTSPAQVFLIDGKNGIVKAVLDGTYVTQIRTGAATGAAFDLLAKKDCRIGALIGTGGQAAAQLEAMLTVRKLEEVRVFDMNPERAQAFAATMQEELLALRSLGTRFIKVSILSTFCVSTFYNFWELFPYLLPDLSDYPLVAAVFGGIFVGIGVGLIVRQGGSSGGDDALALSISKVTHWRLSRCYLFTDLVVLGLSISYIPIIHIVFSVVTVTLSSFLIDLVMMYGRDSQKKIINTSRSEQEC